MDVVVWKYGPAVRAARALPGFLSGWSASRFRGLASGRSAARLARLVRDQEVGGSNPLAPTENQCSIAGWVIGQSCSIGLPYWFPLIVYTITTRQTSDHRGSDCDHGEAQ